MKMESTFSDYVIFGAGMYGLYAASYLATNGLSVTVVENDTNVFCRASYINQARIHNGYHYPRSIYTALKSAHYFDRFNHEFIEAINKEYRSIYAISSKLSYTSGEQFEKFCNNANIYCKRIDLKEYFNNDVIDGAYETVEYSYDAFLIKEILLEKIKLAKGAVRFIFNRHAIDARTFSREFSVLLNDQTELRTSAILNCTYGSVNQVNILFGFNSFPIKYEICEIILGNTTQNISNIGITVMDGPFFSIMPFGKTGFHSLTSVTFTPHLTCYEDLPHFSCQKKNLDCSPFSLQNCNTCFARPKSSFHYMKQLTRKYLNKDIDFSYEKSLFSMKPILTSSELDDSRPTVVRVLSQTPLFISVLSGKINTVFDLEDSLK